MRDIFYSKRKRKGEAGGKFSRNIPRNFKSLLFERCDFRVNYSTQTPKKQHFSADQSEKSCIKSLPTSKSGEFQKVNLLKEFRKKSFGRKNESVIASKKKMIVTVLTFLIVIGIGLFFCTQKSGMFLDEIYSYGLSNSEYAPFLTDVKGGDITNKVITRQELLDYVTVEKDAAFDYASVYYNQVNDVHPPLFYWLLHTVCSFSPSVFSMWQGLALNLLFWIGTLLLLFFTAKRLMNYRAALMAVVLYGLSTVGLSTLLMIRMYMLMAFCTVLFTYFVVRLMECPRWFWYLGVAATIYCGMMTQYYFVFYAFFVCACVAVYFIVKKRWKTCAVFSVCALSGVAAMYLSFPACITHLTDRGMTRTNTVRRIYYMLKQCIEAAGFGVVVAILSVLLLFVSHKIVKRYIRENRIRLRAEIFIFVFSAILSGLLSAIIAPYSVVRYFYNLFPPMFLGVAYLLYILIEIFRDKKKLVSCACLVLTALSIFFSVVISPDWLYPEIKATDKALSSNADTACVYLTNNDVPAITGDLVQLLNFDEVFVSDGITQSKALEDYLASKKLDKIILYICTYQYDADAALSWFSAAFPDKTIEPLYTGMFASRVYFVK